MSIPSNRVQREYLKFQEVATGDVAVKTLSVDDRYVLNSMDVLADWTILTAATENLTTDVNHKEGQVSIAFDKKADATIVNAGIYASPSSISLSRYNEGKIKHWIYIPDLTNVASCSLVIGTSAVHNNIYTTADTSLSAGWNEIVYELDSPTSVTGNGVIWGDIDYISVYVTFDAAANALADMYADAITVYNPTKIEIQASDIEIGAVELKNATTDDRASISDANTARTTATHVLAVQHVDDEGHVLDSSDIDDCRIALQVIDDWDESDRAKVNPIAGQAGIAANAGAMDALTTRVTVATDDTHFGAVGAGSDVDGVVHGQLRFIGEAVDGLETPVTALATSATPFFDADGDNTAQALKASPGQLFKLHVYNPNAADAFVQLFNAATGDVTVGTTTPNFVILVPAQGGVTEDFGALGLNFTTAITYSCTTAPTTNGDPTVGLTLSAAYK